MKALLDGLRSQGWIEGQNLIIEYRYLNARLTYQLPLRSWSPSAPISS
jgi:hypothetical protein